MSVLADTSVWIDYLNRGARGPAAPLDLLLHRGEVVMCGPVASEIVAGTPTDQRSDIWSLFVGLSWIEHDRAHWWEVGLASSALSRLGRHVPLPDVSIAVAAVEAGAELWTHDTDFDQIAAVLPALRRFQPA